MAQILFAIGCYRRCLLKTADGTTKVVLPPLTWIEVSHSTLVESLFILAGNC